MKRKITHPPETFKQHPKSKKLQPKDSIARLKGKPTDLIYIHSTIESNPTKMSQIKQNQGKLDGVEFLHGNPALTLVRITLDTMRLLEDMGLIMFLQQLTNEVDLPLTLQAKRSYNRARCPITITTPQGRLQEILMSLDVVHYTLNLPAVGTIVPTTKEIKQMC